MTLSAARSPRARRCLAAATGLTAAPSSTGHGAASTPSGVRWSANLLVTLSKRSFRAVTGWDRRPSGSAIPLQGWPAARELSRDGVAVGPDRWLLHVLEPPGVGAGGLDVPVRGEHASNQRRGCPNPSWLAGTAHSSCLLPGLIGQTRAK
jgi:hypothetical protein